MENTQPLIILFWNVGQVFSLHFDHLYKLKNSLICSVRLTQIYAHERTE